MKKTEINRLRWADHVHNSQNATHQICIGGGTTKKEPYRKASIEMTGERKEVPLNSGNHNKQMAANFRRL